LLSKLLLLIAVKSHTCKNTAAPVDRYRFHQAKQLFLLSKVPLLPAGETAAPADRMIPSSKTSVFACQSYICYLLAKGTDLRKQQHQQEVSMYRVHALVTSFLSQLLLVAAGKVHVLF
jgi:hypothetical protein